MAIRLIRSNNSGEVTVYDDAVVFHSAKGNDYTGASRGGVFEKVYNAFGYISDNVNKKFIIKSGMGMLYGRQFVLDENETKEFSTTGMAGKYITYYVKIDNKIVASVESTTITLEAQYSSLGPVTLGNTDLIANRVGIATMELYRVFVNASGNIQTITDLRYTYIPGYAEKARMMDAEGVINGRKVNDLVYPDRDLVKSTDHAYWADRAKALGTSGTAANRNNIDDNLFLTNRNAYLVTARTIMLNTAGTTKLPGTHTVSLPNALSNNVIGALLYGDTNLDWSSFYGAIPGANPILYFEHVWNNASGIAENEKIKFTVTANQVTIVVGSTKTITGNLSMTILMLGTR